MRPNAERNQGDDESGRIIYLGDVRRRRAARNRAPDRHYLAGLLLVAAIGWLAWAMVLFTVPPSRLLTYVAFFSPFAVAVAATGAMVSYAIEWRIGFAPSLGVAIRRGVLSAAVLTANLGLAAAHAWKPTIIVISLVAAVCVDIGVSRRARLRRR